MSCNDPPLAFFANDTLMVAGSTAVHEGSGANNVSSMVIAATLSRSIVAICLQRVIAKSGMEG